jgi:hypothetical protein
VTGSVEKEWLKPGFHRSQGRGNKKRGHTPRNLLLLLLDQVFHAFLYSESESEEEKKCEACE